MSDQDVSLFHIHGFINNGQSTGHHRADHVIQTTWEFVQNNNTTGRRVADDREQQCQVYVMDYTSFWQGTLTRQDWEAQRHSRCEDTVNRDLYDALTRDAFRGVPRKEGSNWDLSLSARSSPSSLDDLELTWAGSVTSTISGKQTQQKTILGTMPLEKVAPEESKKILRQWIKTTIELRQKFGHLSHSLKDHAESQSQLNKEYKDALTDFTLEKRRAINDLLEKFRLLINTKKEKIVKLNKANSALQERIDELEKALREERKLKAVLQGKKTEDADIDLSNIKAQNDLDEDNIKVTGATKRAGCGRGRGRGRGRGKASIENRDAEEDTLATRVKQERKADKNKNRFQDAEEGELELLQPLPHPQDGYGWDEDDSPKDNRDDGHEAEEEEEEPLACNRRLSTGTSVTHTGVNSSPSTKYVPALSAANQQAAKGHLTELIAGGHELIDRVTTAVIHASSKTDKTRSATELSFSRRSIIKREETGSSSMLLLRRQHSSNDDDGNSPLSTDTASRKRHHRADEAPAPAPRSTRAATVNKAETPPDNGKRRTRNRHVVAMRKPGTTRPAPVDKNTFDSTPNTSLRSISSSEGLSPVLENKRARTSGSDGARRSFDHGRRQQKDADHSSLISEEDWFNKME